MTAKRLRALCLSLDGVQQVPHMDRAAFRTPQRIFATLAADEKTANLLLPLPAQQMFCAALPAVFAPVDGGWGRMGYTTVQLALADEPQLQDALHAAHARAIEGQRTKKTKKNQITKTSKPSRTSKTSKAKQAKPPK